MLLTKLCSIIVTKWNNLNNKIQEMVYFFSDRTITLSPAEKFITGDLSGFK